MTAEWGRLPSADGSKWIGTQLYVGEGTVIFLGSQQDWEKLVDVAAAIWPGLPRDQLENELKSATWPAIVIRCASLAAKNLEWGQEDLSVVNVAVEAYSMARRYPVWAEVWEKGAEYGAYVRPCLQLVGLMLDGGGGSGALQFAQFVAAADVILNGLPKMSEGCDDLLESVASESEAVAAGDKAAVTG